MVFITSPTCGYCNLPEMPEYVEKSKLKSQKIANQKNVNFVVIGVVIGWHISESTKHLEKFGAFDEVMMGRNWFNIGARKYIYNDVPSDNRASVPQIVLAYRDIISENRPDQKNINKVEGHVEFARFDGVDEIKEFVNSASNDY